MEQIDRKTWRQYVAHPQRSEMAPETTPKIEEVVEGLRSNA